MQWVRQHLVEAGQIDGSTRGVWKLTDTGRARLQAPPSPQPKVLGLGQPAPVDGIDGYGDFRQGAVSIKSAFQAKRWSEAPVGRPEITSSEAPSKATTTTASS